MHLETQIASARKGLLTRQMSQVLEDEQIESSTLLERVAKGEVVIPANHNHYNLRAKGIGKGLSTKINVNLGVSEDCCNVDHELEKITTSVALKADAIMDLSTFGDTRSFRRKMIDICPVMVGTVPVYDAVARYGKNIPGISVDDFFDVVRIHAEDGVDFMTIHAGLTRAAAEHLIKSPRLTHVVSRGGSIMLEWMIKNDSENPFFSHFDRLLELCRRYDVTLSLGDGLRPGCLRDATDAAQIQELIILGELTRRCWDADVQVMIEGPGHVPLNEIVANMQLEKKLCHGAPFYVLGPIVTDIAPGYDHITSAIGGALAAASGADFLCYVTPAEHLRLPDTNDIKEGIIASRIAAHAADIAKGIPHAIKWDNAMSEARKNLDWQKMFNLAIDPEKAKLYREQSQPGQSDVCTMCGDLCAVKRSRALLDESFMK